ncbi:MAG: hypothetical protein MZV63_06425 [Marinilabiliales bacterium]|nr:hypothetical protein [Marinilabiliales bacterium]
MDALEMGRVMKRGQFAEFFNIGLGLFVEAGAGYKTRLRGRRGGRRQRSPKCR